MSLFDSAAWTQLHKNYVAQSQVKSLERWMLLYIHHRDQLNYIADHIGKQLASQGEQVCVQVESVWIDGTPQAEYSACGGPAHSCELGDVLVVVDRFSQAGGTLASLDSRALIVQAKVAPSPMALPVGTSTAKQRFLLENSCSVGGVTLWKGRPGRSSSIGHYCIETRCQGLEGYSTYLIVPDAAGGFPAPFTPFTCAWPVTPMGNATQWHLDYVETLQRLCDRPFYGRLLNDPLHCAWSRMVYDLLNGFQGVWMDGYGGQYRLNRSQKHCFGRGSAAPVAQVKRYDLGQVTPSAAMTLAQRGLAADDVGELEDTAVGGIVDPPSSHPERADLPPGPGMPVVRIAIVIHDEGGVG